MNLRVAALFALVAAAAAAAQNACQRYNGQTNQAACLANTACFACVDLVGTSPVYTCAPRPSPDCGIFLNKTITEPLCKLCKSYIQCNEIKTQCGALPPTAATSTSSSAFLSTSTWVCAVGFILLIFA